MVSSVTEGDVKKLRRAGYLSNDIAHRLPDEGQLIPTPSPMRGWCSSSNHIRSGRQVDGLLRHGGTHQKTEEGRILV